MTKNSKLKRKVRARIEKHGESYQAALKIVEKEEEEMEQVKKLTAYPFFEGCRVEATQDIVEDTVYPDGKSPFPEGYIHAKRGDRGIVEHISYLQGGGVPTVRFIETGTATIVRDDEVEYCGYLGGLSG